MKKKNSINLVTLLVIFLTLFPFSSKAHACWGARPMAMGGAFVGIPGDINDVYWNPAGLATISGEQFTWTSNFTNLESINYDDFFALAIPLDKEPASGQNGPHKTFGLAVVQNEDVRREMRSIDRYLNLCFGLPLSRTVPFFAGVNLKMMYNREENHFEHTTWRDNTFLVDFAFLFQPIKQLSLGLLIQNANEPKVAGEITVIRNVRPGLALFLSPKTILSVEVYDLMGRSSDFTSDNGVTRNLRFGFETKLGEKFAFRCGGYNLNSERPQARAVTAGAGWQIKKWEINYAIINFYEVHGSEFCHQAGLTYAF